MGKDERRKELPRFDRRLRDAVTDDMAAYVGEVMSSVAFRRARKGVHSVRTVQELSSFGWTEVRYPYRRGTDDRPDFRGAFGIERKMTPCASETVSRLAAQLGSFKEARDALALLGCGRMSVSKVIAERHPKRHRDASDDVRQGGRPIQHFTQVPRTALLRSHSRSAMASRASRAVRTLLSTLPSIMSAK